MDIKDFKNLLPKYKAILGIDYGSKRIGLAVSDLLLTVASSYKILYRKDISTDINELKKIIKEKEVGAIVMGLPLQMDGSEGDTAKEVHKFADILEQNFNLPIFLWDERLSSSAVEKFLIKEVDLSRKKRAKVLDSSAAAYILQGVLDSLSYHQ
ncbi:MAG: Holliday junction resolvase RuvX [Alphaproteobacteria bacterium]|nr:Holliday junction resolvase RuvX [Alphaproteobacteria bacterium]